MLREQDDEEQRLVARMLELVREHPRYGYRFMTALLRQEGWQVNRKRVYRLWQQEGLKVPKKQRKKRRLGNSAERLRAARGRASRTTFGLGTSSSIARPTGGRSSGCRSWTSTRASAWRWRSIARMTSDDVLDVLRDLFVIRGVPKHIRSDNGPEFIAQAIRKFLAAAGVETLYIEPGSPWQNGYAESFHSRLRSELLDAEVFENVAEAQSLSLRPGENDYNHRPAAQQLELPDPRRVRDRVCCFRSGCACASAAHPEKKKRKPYQYHYPNPYSHNPWYKIGGIPV